jgi:hypothetical protein
MNGDGGVSLMVRPRRKGRSDPDDRRVAAVVLKDTPEYRDWLTGLSETTLIPVATIVRDALARWASDRGLPGPPTGPTKSRRRIGDRDPRPKRKPAGGDE